MASYTVEDFLKLYSPQYGGNIENSLRFYRPALVRQRGAGLGSFLMNIGRKLIPFAKQFILPHAKKALRTVALDVLDNGANLKESLKKNSISALKAAGRDIINQSGSGRRKKRMRSKSQPKTKSKRRRVVKPKKTIKKKRVKRHKKVFNRNIFS